MSYFNTLFEARGFEFPQVAALTESMGPHQSSLLQEKYEADLKKEIKKLQRFRDQVRCESHYSSVFAV